MGGCVPSDPRAERALALYAALSARDWPAVHGIGKGLLESGTIGDRLAFRTWVLGATEVAALAMNDFDALAAVEQAHGADIRGYAFERQWMGTLALLTRKPSESSAPTGGH